MARRKKRMKGKWKGALVGAGLGFVIPIIILFVLTQGAGGDAGMAVPIFMVFSLFLAVIGASIGYSIQNKKLFFINLIGFLLIWGYFTLEVINYYTTPFYQRGASVVVSLIFPILIINLIFHLGVTFISKWFFKIK